MYRNSLIQKAHQFLIRYLEFYLNFEFKIKEAEVDVDTSLAQLYSQFDHEKLVNFMLKQNKCDYDVSLKTFSKNKCYFALGLLYKRNERWNEALDIWVK